MESYSPEVVSDDSVEIQDLNFAHASFDPSRRPHLDELGVARQVKKIGAAVSPDCSYRFVKEAMEAAEHEILLYIYNISAGHLVALIEQAKNRNVTIKIMYDVTDSRGGEEEKLKALNVPLKTAPSSGGRKVFTVCHQKFAVIDESILLIGSANWAGTSIPFAPNPETFKKGNREWLVRIDEGKTAKWFKKLFEADWNIPELHGPQNFNVPEAIPAVPAPTFVPALLLNKPDETFNIKKFNFGQPISVTPIISPENYFDLIKKLIQQATESIYIEQQYIVASGMNTNSLLSALKSRKNELDIRIIVSPAFRKEGEEDSWEKSVKSLDSFGLKGNLKAMNLDFYTHLHNKGIIFDRKKVIVSSTNWSENSIARAREAGLLIESPDVAGYFADVFDFDWRIGWLPDNVPANTLLLFQEAMFVPGGFEEIHPADLR